MLSKVSFDLTQETAAAQAIRQGLALILFLIVMTSWCVSQTPPAFENVRIGALDARAWNGLVFTAKALKEPVTFAMRVGSHRGSAFLDGGDIYGVVSEVGPYAPDGSYARMGWRQPPADARVTLEWSRIDETTVVGRLSASPKTRLVLEAYYPVSILMGTEGFYRVDEKTSAIVGERYFDQTFGVTARFVVAVDRPLIGSGTYPTINQLQENMRSTIKLVPSLAAEPTDGAAGIEFTTGPDGTAHFVAKLGWERNALLTRAGRLLQAGEIDTILKEKASAYAARRPVVSGLFEGSPEAIGNTMFWNSLLITSEDLFFPSISRAWASTFGGWVVGEWDCFFGSLLTSLEDKTQTEAGIKAILLAQAPNGVVPNIASGVGSTPDRSQPPLGSYLTWKVYQRWQDPQILEWAYPRLKKWHQFWFGNRGDGQPWRDGNNDGLLEWGSDRGSTPSVGGRGFLQGAKWESGMDDSPMWDETAYDPRTYTMDLNDVGLNSMYALDAECLAAIARILGKNEDARKYTEEYARIKQRVQATLWNPEDGIYENRHWDGHFSKRLSPTNFYPMLAGIATPEQAARMVQEHLLNPKEFWGEYVIPTIARNDPAFADQFYWRGNIWGPTNYLLYAGLNRYCFDKVALEFAAKSYALFMDDWKENQHANETYHARGGTGGGDIHYTWGTLLCLIALEQYIDVNPWDGLRFGALSPVASGEFRGSRWENHVHDIAIGPALTRMSRDGSTKFQANGGVVVRDYSAQPAVLVFSIHAEKDTRVTTEEFAYGNLLVKIDGKDSGRIAVQGGKAVLSVPAGMHTVELRKGE